MKFIDEKGRLFGKINLIDLLVIVLLLAVVCAVLWKTVGKRASEAANTQSLRASYTVRCEEVPKEICDFAQTQVGEKLLNNAVFLDGDHRLQGGAGRCGKARRPSDALHHH